MRKPSSLILSTDNWTSSISRLKKDEIKDEPGAEDRFLRGVRKALSTPPKPFTKPLKGKPRKGKDDD